MMGTEDTWGERFAAFCEQAAHVEDLEDHYALLCTLERLTRTRKDARRLVCAARRVLLEFDYAARWAEKLLSEDEGGRPWI